MSGETGPPGPCPLHQSSGREKQDSCPQRQATEHKTDQPLLLTAQCRVTQWTRLEALDVRHPEEPVEARVPPDRPAHDSPGTGSQVPCETSGARACSHGTPPPNTVPFLPKPSACRGEFHFPRMFPCWQAYVAGMWGSA